MKKYKLIIMKINEYTNEKNKYEAKSIYEIN